MELTEQQQQDIKDKGYRAYVSGTDMNKGNPYGQNDPCYWLWRKGYLEAFKDANGI